MVFVSSKSTKIRITWLASTAIVILIYFTHYNFAPQNGSHFLSINSDFVKFFLLFLSNGIVRINEPIQIATSIVLCALFLTTLLYFKFQKMMNGHTILWILLGLLGLLIDFLASSARSGVFSPLSPRYITLSNFFIISIVVMVTITFLQYDKSSTNLKRKKIIRIGFTIFILSIVLGISIVYVYGWKGGEGFHNELLQGKKCIIDPNYNFNCPSIYPSSLQTNAAILQQLHLGPFAELANKTISVDPLLSKNNWNNLSIVAGVGYVDYIDSKLTNSNPTIVVNKVHRFISISGWGLLNNKYNGNSVYVFIDDALNGRVESGIIRPDIPAALGKQASLYTGYEGFIDSNNLSVGCHDVSIRIVKENTYFVINTNSKLCIQ